jgi:hypothetical protein
MTGTYVWTCECGTNNRVRGRSWSTETKVCRCGRCKKPYEVTTTSIEQIRRVTIIIDSKPV